MKLALFDTSWNFLFDQFSRASSLLCLPVNKLPGSTSGSIMLTDFDFVLFCDVSRSSSYESSSNTTTYPRWLAGLLNRLLIKDKASCCLLFWIASTFIFCGSLWSVFLGVTSSLSVWSYLVPLGGGLSIILSQVFYRSRDPFLDASTLSENFLILICCICRRMGIPDIFDLVTSIALMWLIPFFDCFLLAVGFMDIIGLGFLGLLAEPKYREWGFSGFFSVDG